MDSHAGHFLYNFRPDFDHFSPGSPSAYLFSKPLNRLEFDPTYPKNPKTLGDYIRKWRMEQGISQLDLAETLGVDEMTVVNWEIRGMVPRIKEVRESLTRSVEGVGGGSSLQGNRVPRKK
jgi:DNA-binding transcriptional regulator YiaG